MSNIKSELFTEKFRAKKFESMVLPERIKKEVANGLVQNLMLYGPAGSGKSTIAGILTQGRDVLKINGSSENGIDTIRNLVVNFSSTMSLTNGDEHKIIWIDECDGLSTQAWDALRETIEHYADNVRFVVTLNKLNKIPEPIKSRFNLVAVYPINKDEEKTMFEGFCQYVGIILKGIKAEYTEERIREFVKVYFPDMRSILNALQSIYNKGEGNRVLDETYIKKTFDCDGLFELITNSNDPVANYVYMVENYGSSPEDAVLEISHSFVDYIRTNKSDLTCKIPIFIIAIAEYVAQLPTAPDKLIVLLACCFKLQLICRQ